MKFKRCLVIPLFASTVAFSAPILSDADINSLDASFGEVSATLNTIDNEIDHLGTRRFYPSSIRDSLRRHSKECRLSQRDARNFFKSVKRFKTKCARSGGEACDLYDDAHWELCASLEAAFYSSQSLQIANQDFWEFDGVGIHTSTVQRLVNLITHEGRNGRCSFNR